jgi:hypothetical protein
VLPARIIVGAHDRNVVAAHQFAAQRRRVDFRARPVPGKKVVDGVEDAKSSIDPWGQSAFIVRDSQGAAQEADCSRRALVTCLE